MSSTPSQTSAQTAAPPASGIVAADEHLDPSLIRRAVIAASIGNAMEWYDFSVYAFFASYIATNFFSHGDSTSALLKTFVVFGAGFVARPLGAIVLGALGDHRGRKAALTITILLMGLGTGLIGVLPSYARIGIIAPALLMVGRLLQGFSAGGEIGGAAAYLVEHAPARERATWTSWLQASMGISNLLSAIIGFIITSTLSGSQIEHWAWRIPFLIGLLIVPIGYYTRSRLPETATFDAIAAEESQHSAWAPLKALVTQHLSRLLTGAVFSILWTVCVYALIIYLPTYYSKVVHFTSRQAFLASIVGNVVLVIGCVASGRAADRMGAQKVITWGTAIMLFLPLLALVALHHSHHVWTLLLVHAILCGNVSLFAGVAPSMLPRVFPAEVRASGMALSYNIASIFFAGFTPALMTWAVKGVSIYAPALWVMVAAVTCLLVLPTLFRQIHANQHLR